MTPDQVFFLILVGVLAWGSANVAKRWIDAREDEKLAETSNQVVIKALETVGALTKIEESRATLFDRAIAKVPHGESLRDEAENGIGSIVKHNSNHDFTINGVALTSEAASRLTRQTRTVGDEVRLDGEYTIKRVDTSVEDGFAVTVESSNGDNSFVASVREILSSKEDRKVISEAEWGKYPIRLEINAVERRGDIVNATIIRAYNIESTDD